MQARNPSSSAGETSTNALKPDDDLSYVTRTTARGIAVFHDSRGVGFKELAR
ncbi:hypothetical protein SAMN03159382_02395 [Pseudomonas sp. NFACC23-1]|nr:hypothetical protein SAMN03159386_02055 [Pseudomonas sp. NFACC17-2]SEJ41466.1 hypothetical protein SAMN03159382_02395 [Pseudomonas sp. NFACC23-1]SFW66572.1 hypothetical protein SAMN05660640_02603 [Pseudomonas sp. NFACC16-2]